MAKKRKRGALGRRPNQKAARRNQRVYRQEMQNMGALAYNPMYANQANMNYLSAEQQRLQDRIAKRQQRGKKTKAAEAKLASIQNSMQTAQQFQDQQNQFQQLQDQSMNTIGGVMDRVNQQGAFNPGDFMASRQKAADVAMSEFDRLNADRFAQQENQLRERLANQGHMENSELYQNQLKQLRDQQSNERQGALNNAFQLGQGEQAQAYGQSYQTYMTPTQQASMMNPYYSQNLGMNQFNLGQQFQGGQSALERQHAFDLAAQQHKYNMALASKAGGGGGGAAPGMSMDDRFALMDREFYNNMVLQSLQGGAQIPYPGTSGGFVQGVGAGIGAGLGSGLR